MKMQLQLLYNKIDCLLAMLHCYTLQVPQAHRQQPQTATKVETYKKYTDNVVT